MSKEGLITHLMSHDHGYNFDVSWQEILSERESDDLWQTHQFHHRRSRGLGGDIIIKHIHKGIKL